MKNVILLLFSIFLCSAVSDTKAQMPTLLKDIDKSDDGISRATLVGKIDSFAYFIINSSKLWEYNANTKHFQAIAPINSAIIEGKAVYFNQLINNEKWLFKYEPVIGVSQLFKLSKSAILIAASEDKLLILDENKLLNFNSKEKVLELLTTFSTNISVAGTTKLGKDLLVFTQNNEIWKTSGTAATTLRIAKLTGKFYNHNFFLWKDEVFFFFNTSLWKTNGTPQGTIALSPNNSISNLQSNIVFTDNFFYFVTYFAVASELQPRIWKSNGTINGTTTLKSLSFSDKSLAYHYSFNNQLFIKTILKKSPQRDVQIWKDNGDSTTLIFHATPPTSFKNNKNLAFNIQDTVYISIADNDTSLYMVKTDGTKSNTQSYSLPIPNINAYNNIIKLNNEVFFSAANQLANYELWKSNGTVLGTSQVAEISQGMRGSNPKSFFNFEDYILFLADDGKHGFEFWQTDGINLSFIQNLNTSANANNFGRLYSLKNKICFTTDDKIHGRELWSSDGTTEGTKLIRNFSTNSASSTFTNEKVLDGKLYFSVKSDSSANLFQFWETDGTTEGTRQLIDNLPFQPRWGRKPIAKFDNILYYEVENGDSTYYYKFDLTKNEKNASIVLGDIKNPEFQFYNEQKELIIGEKKDNSLIVHILTNNSGEKIFTINNFFKAQVTYFSIYFCQNHIIYECRDKQGQDFFYCLNLKNQELFSIFGYWQSIILYKDILHFKTTIDNKDYIATLNLDSKQITAIGEINLKYSIDIHGFINDKILIFKNSEFYIYDIKTKKLEKIPNIIDYSYPQPNVININQQLFFRASGKIYQTDGTLNGTKIISNTLSPGENMTMFEDNLFFLANDGIHGFEIWKFNSKTSSLNDIKSMTVIPITVYPNPANDWLNINAALEIEAIDVFDAQGRKILTAKVNSQTFQLPIISLENGVVILSFRFKNHHSVIKRVIIQH